MTTAVVATITRPLGVLRPAMRTHHTHLQRSGGVRKLSRCLVMLGLTGSINGHAAPGPSIDAFAARSRVEDVSISPDGRYLAFVETVKGGAAAVILERERLDRGPGRVVIGEPAHFHFV